MAFDSEEFVTSPAFDQALKSAFVFNEDKIISAVSFDVIGIIPHLSESGIMEPNLRRLLIQRNRLRYDKSCLVLRRIHDMGAIGYVRFVVLLQRNSSSMVYRKLADQLLVAAQDLYESWRCGLHSCRHLHTSESSVSRHGETLCSSVRTTSVTRDLWIPGETATIQPDSYHPTDIFKTLPHGTSSRQHPVHQHHASLHAASDQFTPIPDTDYHCDMVTPSVTCFSEKNVCILVQRFCESGGSQTERVGTEKIFRTLMQQAKASQDSRKLVNQVKVYKCCYLSEVLKYYCKHGMRTIQHVHITERLDDLMSSIDADTLSPVLTASLLNAKDAVHATSIT